VTLAFFLMPEAADKVSVPVSPVNYQVVPAPAPLVEQLDQLDLSPSTQGSAGEQVF
jgi:DNA-directed RNA polymerase alpha subunit